VFDPFVVGSMCACCDAYACDRVAYGHYRSASIRHTHFHSHGDADQYPCTGGVGHTYAGADHHANTDTVAARHPNTNTVAARHPNTDAVAARHANTDAHSNLYTNGATYTYPNANRYAHAEPNSGRRAHHRLLPCQRDRG
jgi:hypothetical protein